MRIVLAVVAYLVLGAGGMVGWWLAVRQPPVPPSSDYPIREPPAAYAGERTTWRGAHLDGWKWRLAGWLGEVPSEMPLQPPGDPARSAGFAAGWEDAGRALAVLEARHGAQARAELVRLKRTKPLLYDLNRVGMPPER